MRKTPQTLTFSSHNIRKDFGEVNPDHGALRKGKGGYEADKEPDQQLFMLVSEEDGRHARQAYRRSDRTNQKEPFTSYAVDDRHGNHRKQKICPAHGHRLQVSRHLAKSRVRENVVQVIENGVNAGELIEHADAHGKKDGQGILAREKLLFCLALFEVNGLGNLLQVLLVVF